MFNKLITAAVEKYLDQKYKEERAVLPDGFQAIEKIRGAAFAWLNLPWGQKLVKVKVRVIGAGEQLAVEGAHDRQQPRVSVLAKARQACDTKSRTAWIEYLNLLEQYCKWALVKPTFAEIEQAVVGDNATRKAARADMAKLKAMRDAEMDNRTREGMTAEIEELELAVGYFMPLEFMQGLVFFCEGLDVGRECSVTEEELLEAYALSQVYKNRASDNLHGLFVERHRLEVDAEAYGAWYRKYGKPKGGGKPPGGQNDTRRIL
jgi:hypothetical protein